MDDLIEALTIFRKYANPDYPTHCEHDTLWICIDPELVTDEDDIKRLDELGFFLSDDGFQSFKFGSA